MGRNGNIQNIDATGGVYMIGGRFGEEGQAAGHVKGLATIIAGRAQEHWRHGVGFCSQNHIDFQLQVLGVDYVVSVDVAFESGVNQKYESQK